MLLVVLVLHRTGLHLLAAPEIVAVDVLLGVGLGSDVHLLVVTLLLTSLGLRLGLRLGVLGRELDHGHRSRARVVILRTLGTVVLTGRVVQGTLGL